MSPLSLIFHKVFIIFVLQFTQCHIQNSVSHKKLFFKSRFAQFSHFLSFNFIQAVKRNSLHIEYQQEKKTGPKITVKHGFCSRPSSAVCP